MYFHRPSTSENIKFIQINFSPCFLGCKMNILKQSCEAPSPKKALFRPARWKIKCHYFQSQPPVHLQKLFCEQILLTILFHSQKKSEKNFVQKDFSLDPSVYFDNFFAQKEEKNQWIFRKIL